jgi:hypothetical protein
MKAYRILLHDTRAAAPVELAAEMAHDQRVTEFFSERLANSPHLASIEVWSGGAKLRHLWRELRRAA